MVPEKAPAKIAACNAADNSPKFNQATDRPHFYFNVINPATMRAKTWLKFAAGMGRQLFLPFSPVSLV